MPNPRTPSPCSPANWMLDGCVDWQERGTGFAQLARGYLSEIQMMVRRTSEQLIYGVQFHIEKSFQDWQQDNYWEHRNESRDGRMIFSNFLDEAQRFRKARIA